MSKASEAFDTMADVQRMKDEADGLSPAMLIAGMDKDSRTKFDAMKDGSILIYLNF